jgi:hypothetical protein
LLNAKGYLDSIDCGSFKNEISYTKTSVLTLLGKYAEVIEYIKTLNSTSFNKPYQKDMYLEYFKAMQCAARGDTINSIRLYTEAAARVQLYLTKYHDREVLMDLYVIKSKYEKHDKLIQEIDSLKITGMYDHDFLDALISTTTNSIVSDSAGGK